jgi:phage shock protein PspC (stress-responsive transcriptional regulator)
MSELNMALPLRTDTLLGVCAAIGEDFGFNPTWLRIALAVLLLASPKIVIGAYLALGVAVVLSRLLFPNPRTAEPHRVEQPKLRAEDIACNDRDAPESERAAAA